MFRTWEDFSFAVALFVTMIPLGLAPPLGESESSALAGQVNSPSLTEQLSAAPDDSAVPNVASVPNLLPAANVREQIPTQQPWVWPVDPPIAIVHDFHAPPHRYGAGHRGIDLAVSGSDIRAPAAGSVAFVGVVVDRPLITIDHGSGLVTTLEPVESDLSVGDAVTRSQTVGTIASGGHTAPGAVHFGVRLHGEYINPLLLLGGVPRAVLLPCCS